MLVKRLIISSCENRVYHIHYFSRTVCNPGYYELAGDCVACGDGTYKPALGNEACTPCGYMETTAATASVNISDCGE